MQTYTYAYININTLTHVYSIIPHKMHDKNTKSIISILKFHKIKKSLKSGIYRLQYTQNCTNPYLVSH